MLDHTFHADAIRLGYPRWATIPFGDRPEGVQPPARPYVGCAARILRYVAKQPTGLCFLNKAFLLPRLGRCLVDGSYARGAYWLLLRAVYLAQLEAVMA